MRRGITTYTTLRAALTACILCVLLLSFLSTSLLPAMSLALVTLSIMPVYLVMTGMIAGFVPLAVCALGTISCLAVTGGLPLAGFGALYLLPMLLVFVYGIRTLGFHPLRAERERLAGRLQLHIIAKCSRSAKRNRIDAMQHAHRSRQHQNRQQRRKNHLLLQRRTNCLLSFHSPSHRLSSI